MSDHEQQLECQKYALPVSESGQASIQALLNFMDVIKAEEEEQSMSRDTSHDKQVQKFRKQELMSMVQDASRSVDKTLSSIVSKYSQQGQRE